MYTPRDQPTTDSGFQLIGQFEWAATVVLLAAAVVAAVVAVVAAVVVAAVVAAATLAPIRLAVATADDLTHAALVST